MAYTEIRKLNGRKYYYRVISIRKGKKIGKKRIYMGCELSNLSILEKEREADKILLLKNPSKKYNKLEILKKKIAKLLKLHGVKRAGIFGSYSRGEQKKNSDLDLLIEIKPEYSKTLSLLDIMRLENYLSEKIGKKVDLVEYSSLNPLLKDRILNEEVRII
jgi:predicted nucleotidyltransferase